MPLKTRRIPVTLSSNPYDVILGGIGLNKSERLILTNTTSSGLLNVTDNYENFEILFGNKLNNSFLIPDIGYTFGYSYTPSHKESQYFDWDDRHVLNISAALSDEYTFFQSDKSSQLLSLYLEYYVLINLFYEKVFFLHSECLHKFLGVKF